jgi:membrane-bound lytic murein transglycosylase D
VRRGDTLSEIAERHDVSVSQLQRWNGIGRRSVLQPGQKLKIGD